MRERSGETEYDPDRWVAYRACMLLLEKRKMTSFFFYTLHHLSRTSTSRMFSYPTQTLTIQLILFSVFRLRMGPTPRTTAAKGPRSLAHLSLSHSTPTTPSQGCSCSARPPVSPPRIPQSDTSSFCRGSGPECEDAMLWDGGGARTSKGRTTRGSPPQSPET